MAELIGPILAIALIVLFGFGCFLWYYYSVKYSYAESEHRAWLKLNQSHQEVEKFRRIRETEVMTFYRRKRLGFYIMAGVFILGLIIFIWPSMHGG